jgi:D-amino-acid dehydrogenase
VLGKTLWTLFQRDSPLTVRFRFDPALWAWLTRFALRCNRPAMLESARGIQALLQSSRALYGDLFARGVLDAEWEEQGMLFVFRSAQAMDHYAHTDQLLRQRFDVPARRLDGPALCEMEPALKSGLAGAWYYEQDAHLRSDKLMNSWHNVLLASGVDVRENCSLLGFEPARGRVQTVQTTKGAIATDAVVVATGPWTPLLKAHLGVRLPIQPGKGYSITMARPARCPRIPIIFEEDRVAITPMRSGYRIGSTMEFAGYDATLNRRRLDILRRAARVYLHEPEAEPVHEEWWGWRPMVVDGKPIIGRVPRFENLIVAAGHGMLGLSMATGTGKLVSELLTGRAPHVDPHPYSAMRFG